MADFNFGDVEEIVCQHETGTYTYAPKANESGTRDKGGIRANDDANQVTANGQNMVQLNRTKWSFEIPIAVDSDDVVEDSLNVLARHPKDGIWTITYINGLISKGKGRPVGDLQSDSNAGTMTLKISGGGELKKIN